MFGFCFVVSFFFVGCIFGLLVCIVFWFFGCIFCLVVFCLFVYVVLVWLLWGVCVLGGVCFCFHCLVVVFVWWVRCGFFACSVVCWRFLRVLRG